MFNDLKDLYYKTHIAIFSCAVSYIIEQGTERIKRLTDDNIKGIQGNGLMTADYCQAIVRTSRDIVHKLSSPTELIQFCDAIGLFETGFYTNGECCDREVLEKAVRILVNHELYDDSVHFSTLNDLADYLDMEFEELANIVEI